jgi:integrase
MSVRKRQWFTGTQIKQWASRKGIDVQAAGMELNDLLRRGREDPTALDGLSPKEKPKEHWLVDYVDQKRDRCFEVFEKKKDALDYHATVKVDVRKGTHVAPRKSPTVAEAADRWLNEVDARKVERTTADQYRQHVNLHIVPLLGRTKLAALNHDRVKAFRDELLAKLSRPTARKVLISFQSMLKVAHYSHVGAGISIRPDTRKRRIEAGRDFPHPAEVTRLLVAAKHDPKRRAFLLIACFTGLRASELRGLRWADLDLKSCELHVRQRADRHSVIGLPKSDSSVRTIPLDKDVMVPALMEWKIKCPPSDFVFPTSTGAPEHHANILRGLLPIMKAAGVAKQALDKNGKPWVTHKYALHAFRHFFASWCINPKARGGRELSPKVVQELLGHSSIMMTMNVYAHLFPSDGNRDELNAAVKQLIG